tara:strand:+ start:61 stop:270 length:210 start_codon:yes stop_codon:yes gene_type:complete
MNIDKIIQIIRELKEEGSSIANVSGPQSLGFDPQNFETPPVFVKKKKKNLPTIIGRGRFPGARKRWKNK